MLNLQHFVGVTFKWQSLFSAYINAQMSKVQARPVNRNLLKMTSSVQPTTGYMKVSRLLLVIWHFYTGNLTFPRI